MIMKVDFINSIRAAKSEIIKTRGINIPTGVSSVSRDSTDLKRIVIKPAGAIIDELCGTFSKDDLIKVDKYVNSFLQVFDLAKEKTTLGESVLNIIQQNFQQSKDDDKKFVFVPQNITNETKNTIHDTLLKLYAIKQISNKEREYVSPIPFNRLFDTNLGIQNVIFPHSIFMHPRDKAVSLTGKLVKEDYEKIKEYETNFAKLSEQKQLKKKEQILKTLYRTFLNPESDFIGTFSDKQLCEIKKLVISYDALDNCLKQKGVFTKGLEKTIYSSIISTYTEKGDYINGLGLVVNKINIKKSDGMDVPAIIVFSNDKNLNTFRMYDLAVLNNLKSPEEEKNALISEIKFRLNDENKYFVRNFRNYDSKKYPDAGKIVGLQLMKLLAEKNCCPIELEALAYAGSKRSPVNYYRYFGFKPVSHTQEEIEKILKENNGVFPYDIPVKMCMDNFEEAKKRIKLMEKVYFKK